MKLIKYNGLQQVDTKELEAMLMQYSLTVSFTAKNTILLKCSILVRFLMCDCVSLSICTLFDYVKYNMQLDFSNVFCKWVKVLSHRLGNNIEPILVHHTKTTLNYVHCPSMNLSKCCKMTASFVNICEHFDKCILILQVSTVSIL